MAKTTSLHKSEVLFVFGFGTPNELEIIPGLMLPGENMEAYVKAVSRTKQFGILVLTNKRMMFVAKGLSGNKTEDFPFDQISSLDCTTPALLGYSTVSIQSRGGFSEYQNVPKKEGAAFVQRAREHIYASKSAPQPAASKYDQLEKLAALKSSGVLTEEEFQAEKSKLLNA